MNPYSEYYEAIVENKQSKERFDNANPYDIYIVDATIHELTASELRVKAAKKQLGNVRPFTKRETILDKVRRALRCRLEKN
jgi:hypothetical protein